MAGNAAKLTTLRLSTPASPEALASLALGNVVYLDGLVYTAREGVYKRILEQGESAPLDLAALSNVNFHGSPAAARDGGGGYHVGAVTATASLRFSKWMRVWFRVSGAKVIIGKGGTACAEYRRAV